MERNRSIDLLKTLAIIGEHLPLTVHQVPSGTPLYDWKAPQEWIIREAYIADRSGNRVVDFARHNLHVVNFSIPMRTRMPLSALKAQEILHGVFADDTQVLDYQHKPSLTPNLQMRLDNALETFWQALHRREIQAPDFHRPQGIAHV